MKQKILFFVFIAFFTFPSLLKAQNITVSGTVKSEIDGEPLIGVSISIKGTQQGVISDMDGNYSIVCEPNSTLAFTYIGFQKKEIKVNNQKVLNVLMQEDSALLDEVVVVGYGIMKKSDLTGSVASVKGDEVSIVSSGSVEKLLQGRVSGLTIINNAEDNPQGGATVRIRGVSSINASNAPLVVVDGIPMGDAGNLNNINPNIIESIEVLKDASGTAIYGSRGANGVIMITTKSGSGIKPNVWVNAKLGAHVFSKSLDYWKDPLSMAMLENEAYENAGLEPIYIGKKDTRGTYYPSIAEIRDGIWPYHTDWEDYVFRNALTKDYNIGVEGGSKESKYYASLGYYKGEGMQKADDYDKISLDLSYSNKLAQSVTVSSKAGFVKGKRNLNYGMSYNRNPLFPVYNGEGTYFKAHTEDYGNPVMMTNERKNVNDNIEGYAIVRFDWDIIPDLRFSASGSARGGNYNSSYYNPPIYTQGGDLYDGEGGLSTSNFYNLITDAYATYNKTFAEKHSLSAMVGTSLENNKTRGNSITGRGFQNHILKDENLAGAETRLVGNSQVSTRLLSYFTRLNYTLDNKYLFTFTARSDGSSKFGKDNKWGFFPSGAVSWRASEEKFLKDVDWMNQLKLRASYGVSGNQGISAYQTFEQFGSSYYFLDGEERVIYGVGKQIGREGIGDRFALWGGMENQELSWEKTSQFDVGLDMSVIDSRINLTLDYYYKKTTDLLRQKFLPPSSGYDRVWVNDGEIENKGVEFTLTGHILTKGDWKFSSTFMINANRNKVIGFGSKEDSGYIDINGIKYLPYGSGILNEAYLNVLALGYPVNSFFGYQVDGIIQEKTGSGNKMTQPGEFNYIGLNEDGTLNANQRTIIGDPNPKFTGSLSLDLSHKSGIDLSVLLYGVYGNDIFSLRKLESPELRADRWTPENPHNERPKLRADRQYYASSWFVEDGSFLRVQNITLGYTFPEKVAKKFANSRVYLNVSNPVTFSNVSEYDPEVGEDGRGNVAFPRICTFTAGIEVKF